jgi:Fe-S-cluster containining protein
MLLENRCTVYEFRPEDCRSFPHLHKDEFVFRLIQAVQNCSICPIVFHVFERLKNDLLPEGRGSYGLMDEEAGGSGSNYC